MYNKIKEKIVYLIYYSEDSIQDKQDLVYWLRNKIVEEDIEKEYFNLKYTFDEIVYVLEKMYFGISLENLNFYEKK